VKKTLLTLIVAAVATPAAAWAVPPGHAGGPNGNGGPNHNPPGLTKADGDNGNSSLTPAAECAKERRDLGVDKFNDKYGTGTTDRNAFGKCVSAEARKRAEDRADDRDDE
jgi:hypothetical protein